MDRDERQALRDQVEMLRSRLQAQPGSDLVERLVGSYSHWIRLVRVAACFKLLVWWHEKDASTPRADAQHLQRAEDSLIAYVQMHRYPDELIALLKGKEVPSSSPLRELGLTLVDGLIMATGRLTNAQLPIRVKQPPIIPHEHPTAETIVRLTHEKTAHSGREYVVAELRCKYLIVGVRGLVRQVLRRATRYLPLGAADGRLARQQNHPWGTSLHQHRHRLLRPQRCQEGPGSREEIQVLDHLSEQPTPVSSRWPTCLPTESPLEDQP